MSLSKCLGMWRPSSASLTWRVRFRGHSVREVALWSARLSRHYKTRDSTDELYTEWVARSILCDQHSLTWCQHRS